MHRRKTGCFRENDGRFTLIIPNFTRAESSVPASSTSHANWRTRFHVTLLGLTLCAVAVTVQAAPPATTILSRLAGGPVANGASQNGVLSSDGGSMAFVSAATNLDPEGDTNDVPDLFFLDRNTGVLERFKVTIDGLQPNGDSSLPSLSAGGRYVAFVSDASNLVPGDTNGQTDVFRWDRLEGTVTRVSVADNETQANHFSHGASITADGETISFVSNASNLVNGDTNGKLDIFVRDLVNGSTERVTLSSDGAEANGSSPQQSITSNGRYVSFRSLANNLVADDTNTQYDIFVRDRLLGTTLRASVGDDEQQANNLSGDLSRVSLDGRYVLFSSLASNLVADDTNNRFDIFRRDLLNGTTERVSVAADGAQGND
jgi:Tol biopolymer transport system component